MLSMSPCAVRWLLAEYEPPGSSQVQQLRLVLLSFPSVISFFFFLCTPYRGACENAVRSSVRLDQCANGTANITHNPDSSLAVTTQIISNGVNMSQEYYLLLLHVRCGTAVEHIPAWCSADCQRACLHQRKKTKTRTSCTFIATVSVIWLTLRFFFFF